MRTCIKIAVLHLISISVAAQQSSPDSLKQGLKIAGTDSAKTIINYTLAYNYSEYNRDSALYFTNQALLLAKKNNKQLDEAFVLDQKGYILTQLGKYAESFKCFQAALKIAENPENETRNWFDNPNFTLHINRLNVLSSVHHDFGHLLRTSGKTEQAIFQYNETKKIAEETNNTYLLGLVNKNLGKTYLGINKLDSALILEQNAIRIINQTGGNKYLSDVYNIMGQIYQRQNNSKLAIQYFHKGIESGIERRNFTYSSANYSSLTEFYLETEKNKDSSLYYAKRNLSLLLSMGAKDLGNAYSNLFKSYQLNNNTDSAYKYQGLAIAAKDSTYAAEIKSLSDFQNLSFDEQFHLQALEKEKIKTQNKIRTYGLLAGLAVFSIIAFMLNHNNRQKQKANKVLESTLANLKSTQSQLIQSEKMASLGELTAGIAHEIQNPLNFVNNFSDLSNELIDEMNEELDKGDVDEAKNISSDIKQNLEKISHHGKRADAIVKGMLQHSRSSTGQKEPTDINALCDEYLRLSYHGLRAKDKSFNADFKTDFDETIVKVNVVPQDIGRVLLNLFNNAFYAVNEKQKGEAVGFMPTVSVQTKKLNDKVEIFVKDNGLGIPQNIVDKIFQPFFTTKPTGQGTGLGLSLAYDIVKAHGGEIRVETKEGEGSEFIIELSLK